LISSLGVGDTVRLAGPQPQSEVITLLQEASVFAVPCVVGQDGNRDGLPTVLLEAMALGTPCVSTNVTGIPEIIKNNETGLLVNQHDSDALAIAIKQLLDDAALRERLAVQARQLIEEHFDVHQNAARIRALFDDIRQIRASGPRAIAQ
jgi:glycosyltransferase involved in cell wall biosynthesis